MRRFFTSIWIMFLLGVTLGVGTVVPKVKAGDCGDNFLVFLSSLLDRMAFEDYWQDYFVRNKCQQDDIFALDEEIENLLEELAEEFGDSCASPEISELQEEIRQGKMETYFVRHIMTLPERSAYKDDAEAIQAAAEAQAAAEETDGTRVTTQTSDGVTIETTRILGEMTAKFVEEKKWVSSEEEMKILINAWVEEYDYRIPLYWDCSISPWEEVALKFKELADTFTSLSEINSFKDRAAEIHQEYQDEKEARQAEQAAQGVKDGGEKDAPGGWQTLKSFLTKHIEVKIREIPPQKNETQLAAEIEGLVTFETLFEAMADEEARYLEEVVNANLLGEYWSEYNVNNGTMIADLVWRIEELSSVIKLSSTAPEFLPGLSEAAKGVHKKQGSGTVG